MKKFLNAILFCSLISFSASQSAYAWDMDWGSMSATDGSASHALVCGLYSFFPSLPQCADE